MTIMNISLPDEMQAFVEAQMATEGYASASEYLRALIREAQKRQAKQALEAKFREALDSGPATPMSKEDWAALRREALEGLAGETIRPRVRSSAARRRTVIWSRPSAITPAKPACGSPIAFSPKPKRPSPVWPPCQA